VLNNADDMTDNLVTLYSKLLFE